MSKAMDALRYNLYRAKYRFGQHLPLTTPVDVSLELASLCNMSCTYCYHASKETPFKQKVMPWELAKKIIDQAAELGVNSLKFNYRGESTINPNFERITSYAKSFASGSTFIDRLTNSNFKFRTDREDIFEGLSNQTKVKISYDSFKPLVFNTQRAGGDWHLTTRNIDKFYNHPFRRCSETAIVIQAVRTNLNKNEDIEHEAKLRWPEAEISIRDMVEGRIDVSLDTLTNKKRDVSERKSCIQAHVRLIFTHEGKALACCPSIMETLVLGNIKHQTIKEIFNGKIARQLRKDLLDKSAFKKHIECKNCSSFESYKNFTPNWGS